MGSSIGRFRSPNSEKMQDMGICVVLGALFYFLSLNLRDEPRLRNRNRWAGSAGGPPLRLLRMDPGKDEPVHTASPQRTSGAVFLARTCRRLRSSPTQMIPRISLGFPDFSWGCRRGGGAAAVYRARRSTNLCRVWHGILQAPLHAAAFPTRARGTWPLTSGIQPGVSARPRHGFRGTPPTALMPSLTQRSACGAVRGNNPAVRGTNPAHGPLMTTKFLEKTCRLGFRSKLVVSAAALQTPSVQVGWYQELIGD